ncbi:MAG: DUF1905 domain-containing protein [Acidimicrobiia bacterium]|nr:DUF1905 domain-containing protein [Acidimicrobiia bacterium]
MDVTYSFTAELFKTEVEAAWVFVPVPKAAADEIFEATPRRPGFGSIRVAAVIGSTEWTTSIFPSKEFGSYLLPINRQVRESEQIDIGDAAEVTIRILDR